MTDFALPLPKPDAAKPRAGFREAFRSQVQVIHAVMLHDIKSRFFGNGLGYVLTILWPGAHIAVIVIAHAVLHREMPYGDSALLYAATGVLPYICWNYISRFTMTGFMQNRSFLQYPVIKPLDLMIARQFLEIVSVTIVTIGLCIVLILCQANPMPIHPGQAALGMLSAIFLGIGFGVFNACICGIFPFWFLAYILILISMYFTSGVIINPESLPASIGDILAWNPLLHSVEWVRSSYYDDYPTRLLSKVYVFYFGGTTLALGLVLERILRFAK